MEIRRASLDDLDALKAVYEKARQFMAQTGNPTQWQGGYPARELLVRDIEEHNLYAVVEGEQIVGCFFFSPDADPDYNYIENGQWRNDLPYGVIHRIASSGAVKGVFERVLSFCKEQVSNIRMDTHDDNKVMQHILEKNGFVYCGVVYIHGELRRIAYHYVSEIAK